MRYENIYSSFPCPASGHFSAASSRVGIFSAASFLLEKMQLLFSGVCIFLPFLYPDARRVAPISACVSSSTKRYHKTLPQNATSNGGDASRVGIFSAASFLWKRCSYCLVEFVFPSPFSIPMNARRVAPISV